MNPIEMAFAKLNAHLRAAGARTYDALWRTVGDICSLFDPRECWNFLKHAGYASDKRHGALARKARDCS